MTQEEVVVVQVINLTLSLYSRGFGFNVYKPFSFQTTSDWIPNVNQIEDLHFFQFLEIFI